MPLVSQSEVRPLIRASFHAGVFDPGPEAADKVVHGKTIPVLVDFEKSVIDPPREPDDKVSSQVERRDYRGPMKFFKRLVSPVKKETLRCIDTFADQVKQRSDQPLVLVVGGGTIGKGMGKIYDDPTIRIVAFDIYRSPNIQFVADAHQIPLKADTFDGVVVQAVLEHVVDPAQVVGEIWRVLKPEGIVWSDTPFMQQVHEGAYDFTRFTESGHRYLFRNFQCIDSGASGGPGIQFMWSVDYLFRGLFRSRTAGKIAKLLVFWAQYLDRLIPEAYRVDGASGTYFIGRKVKTSIGAKDAISHYQGAQ